jgi:hypothetical protein
MIDMAGRPTIYDESFCSKVDEYIKTNQDVWSEFHKTRGEKSDSYDRIVKVNLPTRYGFAEFIGVSLTTIDTWEKQYPSFLGALQKIEQDQKKRLIEEGLSGNYNSTIAKLVLSANHGMREGQDLTSGGKEFGTLDTIIAACELARKKRE